MLFKSEHHQFLSDSAIRRLSLLLFALTFFVQFPHKLGPSTPTRVLNNVVVAKVDIPVGSRISLEQLEVAQFPSAVTPKGAISTIDDKIIGRVVQIALSPKDPITESKLAPVGAAGGLSSTIPEGYRAMTVKFDDSSGVSRFIMPGTLVDVVVVITTPKNDSNEMISKIVLQNIKVLAFAMEVAKPKNDRDGERSIKAVTLQVTPEQAEHLALASSEGRIQLVMRNLVDPVDKQSPVAKKRTLLTGERAWIVPKLISNNSRNQLRIGFRRSTSPSAS